VFNTDGKDESAGPMFNIDPAKLTEQASKTNFVGSIPPEVMAKIAAGGEEGAKAAMSAVNHVAQTSYAQSTLVAAKLVEAALEKQGKHYEEVVIPQLVKNLGVQQSLQDNNPALNHPAIAPVAAAVRDQLSKQHPEASQKEIAAMTQDYMSAFAQAVNPPKETTQQGGRKAKEVDWSTFLSN
jgi:2,4-dienoyl-CoA reductase-like NADH-dependent reductase (Old Yellow Enzyme family)